MFGWNESTWLAVFLGAALKSSVLLAAAWLLARVLHRQSAAARHLVWTAAAAALLVLPLLSISLPALKVRTGALGNLVPTVTFRTTAVDSAGGSASVQPSAGRVSRPVSKPAAQGNGGFPLALLWCAGTALAMAQMLLAWTMMGRLRRSARPLEGAPLLPALARALGIRRAVSLLEIERGGMPVTFGILRPAVFLPRDAGEWGEDRRRVVLLHELAHVRRGDLATQLVARAALALYWWNPLVWLAWREFVQERERAADDLVLTAGESAPDYAGHLLEIARSMQREPALVSAAVAMARPSQLEGRLVAILDARIRRHSPRPWAIAAAGVLAVAMLAPLAALRAQDKPDPAIQPTVDATIRTAIETRNNDLTDSAAAAYASTQKYDAARQLLDTSLSIRGQNSGERSSAYAVGLMKLGDLSVKRGKGPDAVDFYTRAVALGDTPDTAPGLVYLATSALVRKDPIAAEGFIERALAAAPSGPIAGHALTVKGNIANANGLAGVAEMNYLQALAQDEPDSAGAAYTMETYAQFLSGQSRDGEAEAMRQQALPIRQARVAEIAAHAAHAAGTEAQAAADSPQRVGNGVAPPVLLQKQEPEYSEDARVAKRQGTALFYVLIGADGQATNLRLVKSLGFGLDEKGAAAILQWKFQPGKKDGTPVPVEATIEVNFRLL